MTARMMKKLATVWLLFLSTALPVLAAGPHGLDGDNWLEEIETEFAGVKGYSAVLVHEDGYVLQKAGGWAGPGQAMTWDHFGNIGSANKMVASLLLLRVIENKVGRGNLAQIHAELDKPVYQYMPTIIQQQTPSTIHAKNKQITFRHLLQHKSGLRTEHESGNPFHDFLDLVSAYTFNVRSYNNTNMKLLTYLIVAYANPDLLAATNEMIEDLDLEATSDLIPQHLGQYYEGLVENGLLIQNPQTVFGTCWPHENIINAPSREIALMYWTKTDALSTGGVYSGGQSAGHCKGQGGWYYSARGLARLFRYLGTNQGVISPVAYESMYDYEGTSAERDDRLGWNYEIASATLTEIFGWNAVPRHGGSQNIDHPDGHTITARAGIVRLPGGYHAIALVNSSEMSSYDVTDALKNAFARSLP